MELLSRKDLQQKLLKDENVLIKALVAINAHQTEDERQILKSVHLNGYGFRPCHAKIGTGMVKYFFKRGHLTNKQIAFWTKERGAYKPRILIYFNQLYSIHTKRYKKENESWLKNLKLEIIWILMDKFLV